MKIPFFPKLACPECQGKVNIVERDLGAGGVFWMLFGDWPFWLMFLACGAIGIWSPLAAVIAMAWVALLFWLWYRSDATYQCQQCEKRWSFDAVEDAGASKPQEK